jgi:hypothetical protein
LGMFLLRWLIEMEGARGIEHLTHEKTEDKKTQRAQGKQDIVLQYIQK